VAITFDDGPDPRTLRPLLDLLAREKATATFFLVGRSAAAHPTLVREIVAAGHEVGNHSQTHDPFLMLRSCRRLAAEIEECQDVLARLGVIPLVFRPPVGITNPRLLGALRSQGLACVAFSCRPLDFGNRRLKGLKDRVLRRVRGGDIVLLHDRLPGDVPVARWLEEIAGILAGLREMGLRVAPLSELVGFGVMRVDPPPPGNSESQGTPAPLGQGVRALRSTMKGVPAAARALFLGAFPLLVAGGLRWSAHGARRCCSSGRSSSGRSDSGPGRRPRNPWPACGSPPPRSSRWPRHSMTPASCWRIRPS
jgi:hypothetical protein